MADITFTTIDGAAAALHGELIDRLREAVAGTVLTPGDEGFADATLLWNGMIRKQPALVVQPDGSADVAIAVRFAHQHGIALSVRGGGHNIAGTSIAEGGLTIDMSQRRRVEVDPEARTARAESGCLLRDVDAAAQQHGLATPLGFISEVGIAGLTLGGGFGYLTRRFGWTVDNLLEVEIVTADGRVLRAAPDEHEDLFWAVRGAGANMGAVTSFTYRLHPVGPMVYGGIIAWPFDRADEIMRAYRALTAEAPRELTLFMVLMHAPAAPFVEEQFHGAKSCAMAVCYSGDPADAEQHLAPLRAIGDPVVDLLAEQPFTAVQSNLDAFEPKGMHYNWKTEFASELDDGLLLAAREAFADCPIPEGQVVLAHVGGALNEREPDDGAVGNRDVRYIYGADSMWEPGEPRADEFRAWVLDAWARMRPFSTGGNYVNFQGMDEGEDRIRATYGANYDRLAEVKRRYDPENLFRSNRNVRPAGASAAR